MIGELVRIYDNIFDWCLGIPIKVYQTFGLNFETMIIGFLAIIGIMTLILGKLVGKRRKGIWND